MSPAVSLWEESFKALKAPQTARLITQINHFHCGCLCMRIVTHSLHVYYLVLYSYSSGVAVPGSFKNTDRHTCQLNKPNSFPKLWLWFHQRDFEFLLSASMLSTYGFCKHVFKMFSKFPKWTLEQDSNITKAAVIGEIIFLNRLICFGLWCVKISEECINVLV